MVFVNEQDYLICASTEHTVQVVDLIAHKLLHSFGSHRHTAPIRSLSVSADGQWVAAGDVDNDIFVYNMDTALLHNQLPVFDSGHTVLEFHPRGAVLVVACWSGDFYLYDVEEKRLQDYSAHGFTKILPLSHPQADDPEIIGVAFNPTRPDVIIFYSHQFLCRIDLQKPRQHLKPPQSSTRTKRDGKQKRIKSSKKSENAPKGNDSVRVVDQFRPILFAGFTDDGTMAVVERPWLQILESLPNTLYRPRLEQHSSPISCHC